MINELLITSASFFTIIVGLFIIYYAFVRKNNSDSTSVQEYTKKGQELIHQASLEAQQIITNAELDSIKHTAQEKIESRERLNTYEYKLNILLNEIIANLSQSAKLTEQEINKVAEQFEQQTHKVIKHSSQELDRKLQHHFAIIEETLSKTTQEIRERTTTTLSEEFHKIQAELKEYRQQRIAIVDADIAKIIEQVLKNTSGQVISTDQHLQLIIQALEQAKKDNFFKENGKSDGQLSS